jgi:tRNA (guanine37-N1)-methyltransferase
VGVGQRRVVLTTPQGRIFNQTLAAELSTYEELVFICGHYEGYDERIRAWADEEISLGDFVGTGGELPAMLMIDAVARLWPGVLGQGHSLAEESYTKGLLEYPQYTRPPEFAGECVPEILLSGHHAHIARWRRKESWRRTFQRRPDIFARLLEQGQVDSTDYLLLEELRAELPNLAPWRERWQFAAGPPKKRRAHRDRVSQQLAAQPQTDDAE